MKLIEFEYLQYFILLKLADIQPYIAPVTLHSTLIKLNRAIKL
jgi:hypothetical protein